MILTRKRFVLLFSVSRLASYQSGSFADTKLQFFSILQVFRVRTPPEAIALVSRLLEYTPGARITPLQACAHPFFNELREGNKVLPNGREFPPLFNFTEQGENY